ncbi:tetratricopeptide repeat protein [Nostoc sp. TCL26-01]|uniref:tetratricopeptide repeat protein n=1 Tax=Nostoc sp. TCL26-01 TaxID=2576904 RepID=UPI0021172DA6|nr:tetratricopeptide repeat protein [Nostoc sp. TCL26-01]
MIRNRYLRTYLLIGITSFLIVITQPLVLLAQAIINPLQQAEILIQTGQEQLNQGQVSEALQSWEQATKIYRQLRDDEGITGSLINQSVALQSLGLFPRACNILVEALKLNPGICDTYPRQATEEVQLLAIIEKQTPSSLHLLGLQNLGNVLRRLGKLSESEQVLQTTLRLSQQTFTFDNSSILLSLGNTKFTFYKLLKSKYSQIEEPVFQKKIFHLIQQKALEAIDIYQQINSHYHTSTNVKLQSLLQNLNLILDFQQWSNNHQYENQIRSIFSQLSTNKELFEQLSVSESIYSRLNFANSLNKILSISNLLHLSRNIFHLLVHYFLPLINSFKVFLWVYCIMAKII